MMTIEVEPMGGVCVRCGDRWVLLMDPLGRAWWAASGSVWRAMVGVA